jgi:hypothetical protein
VNKKEKIKVINSKNTILIDNKLYVEISYTRKLIRQHKIDNNLDHRRGKKEIAIFIQRLRNVWISKSHLSFAQLIGFSLIGYGFHSFKKDSEIIKEMEFLYNKDHTFILLEIKKAFSYDNPNTKRRRYQIDIFLGRIKKIWKNNPCLSFSELIGQTAIGKTFCSFKKDKDVIKNIENVKGV